MGWGGQRGEIYRLELDGTVLGKFGTAGKLLKEFGTVNEIDCRNPNELIVAHGRFLKPCCTIRDY